MGSASRQRRAQYSSLFSSAGRACASYAYGRGFNPHRGLASELGKLIRSALGLIHILHLLSLDAAIPRAYPNAPTHPTPRHARRRKQAARARTTLTSTTKYV